MRGSENMRTEDDTRKDMQESASLADRLPELDEDQMMRTQEATSRAWAYSNLSAGVGYVWTHADQGVSLQVTSDDTMRLLTVIDHPYCLFMVAMMTATLENLGLKMDLSQAIVAPYVEGNNVTGSPSADRPAQGDGDGVEVV